MIWDQDYCKLFHLSIIDHSRPARAQVGLRIPSTIDKFNHDLHQKIWLLVSPKLDNIFLIPKLEMIF